MNKDMRISDEELSLLKATFSENDKLLKLLRKLFLPEITADAPIGQNIDLWMTINLENKTPEQAIIDLKARNSLIGHIESQLVQIKMLAGMKDETVEETKARLKQDSSK